MKTADVDVNILINKADHFFFITKYNNPIYGSSFVKINEYAINYIYISNVIFTWHIYMFLMNKMNKNE